MNIEHDLAAAAVWICQQRQLKLVRELGRGAFKRAYLVLDNGAGRALKLAPIDGSPDRLERETAALHGCTHPNIAKLLDARVEVHENLPIWVAIEEYIPGGTLQEKLATNIFSVLDVLQLGRPLAHVLDHLNQRRLVHRDIKPANILFAADDVTPVLTDFGVVRVLDAPSLTRDFLGAGPGTPAYAAPEQLNNDKAQIDWRTDQFGLGVVLAECVLRRHPYTVSGENLRAAIPRVGAREHLPIETMSELCSLGLSALVRMLEPWPVQRFRKPSDLIAALS